MDWFLYSTQVLYLSAHRALISVSHSHKHIFLHLSTHTYSQRVYQKYFVMQTGIGRDQTANLPSSR